MSIIGRRRGVLTRRSGGSFGDDVWDAMPSPSSVVYVTRVSADEYRLEVESGKGAWARWTIGTVASLPGSKTPIPHQMRTINVDYPQLLVDDNDASFTYTGAGWSVASGVHRTSTAGDSVTYDAPSGTTNLSLVTSRNTNCGFGRVLIDSDPNRANLLTTAQEEVDAGRLPSAALVANGGTLDPDDRVFDFYNGGPAVDRILVADGLSPDSDHELTIECTGYKRAVASDVRIVIGGARYGGRSLTNPATSSVIWTTGKRLMTLSSAFEFAYRMQVGGTVEWVGNIHGWAAETAWSVSVDGSPVSMTNGQILSGSEVIFESSQEFFHPNVGSGSTKTADCLVSYVFDQGGLRIDHETTWQTTMTPYTAYPAMFPVQDLAGDLRYETFHLGSGSTISTDRWLGDADNSRQSLGHSDTAWMWSPGGSLVVAVRVEDVDTALQGFTYSGTDEVFIEDRGGASNSLLNKIYFTLMSDTVSVGTMPDVTVGSIWGASSTYRIASVTDADALCSRP